MVSHHEVSGFLIITIQDDDTEGKKVVHRYLVGLEFFDKFYCTFFYIKESSIAGFMKICF